MARTNQKQPAAAGADLLSGERRAELVSEAQARLSTVRRLCAENTSIESGLEVTRDLAHAVDGIIIDLLEAHVEAAAGRLSLERLTVVALGGFGRETLNLYSDIDLLFLVAPDIAAVEEAVIKSLTQILWDVGLDLGQTTRTIPQCLEAAGSDLESVTALMDGRYLAGNRQTFKELMGQFVHRVHHDKRNWFLTVRKHKWDERRQRFGATVYSVEPNVKEAKGCLRDYHTLRWLLFAVGGKPEISHLVAMGLMTLDEFNELIRSIDFLSTVRNLLHELAGRKSDTLTFERQTDVAARLGYVSDGDWLAEERFMRDFYHHARVIHQLTSRAVTKLGRAKPSGVKALVTRAFHRRFSRRKLGGGLYVESGRLELEDDPARYFGASPNRLLRIFQIASSERVRLDDALMAAMRQSAAAVDADAFRRDPQNRRDFLRVLGSRGWACPVVRDMYDAGVLTLYLPEFEPLYCLAQVDRYHYFTTDEHSIRTLHHSDSLTGRSAPQENGLLEGLRVAARQIQRWDLLNLALLVHDIGKGEGHGHVLRGGKIAQRIGDRMGLDEADTQLVRFLVLEHLRLIHAALRRDLSDPEVIRSFANAIGDVERLRMLYLLTTCDLMAVGPEAWTEWKAALLHQLYAESMAFLEGGELKEVRIAERTELAAAITDHFLSETTKDKRGAAKQALDGGLLEDVKRFVRNLPPSYMRDATVKRMAEHFELLRKLGKKTAIVWRLRKARRGDYSTLTVFAAEHPGIFSLVCGALASKGINILNAQIHTTRDGYAIDHFQITDSKGGAIPRGFNLDRVRCLLNEIIRGKTPEAELIETIPDSRVPAPELLEKKAPTIIVDNESSRDYTIVEVKTFDQPGLLHRITRALYQCGLDVNVALIATEAYRVVDVFYVTDLENQKLEKPSDIERLKRMLEETLDYEVQLTVMPAAPPAPAPPA